MVVQLKDRSLTEEVAGIRDAVLQAFQGRFKEPMAVRTSLEYEGFNNLTEVERCSLEAEFSRDEIKVAVWESDGEKSPGLDGFNLRFI